MELVARELLSSEEVTRHQRIVVPRSGSTETRKRSPSTAARKRPARASRARSTAARSSAAEVREVIARGIVAPLNLVMLTRERIEEVLDEAVKRGRMTRDDAQDLLRS